MINILKRDGHMDIVEITEEEFSRLDERLQKCIRNKGEYGYVHRGKTRCEHAKPETDCPFYNKNGCKAHYNLIIITSPDNQVTQSIDSYIGFSDEDVIELD